MNKERVLLIDDNNDFVTLTCDLLEMQGYETIAANTGVDGIAKAKTAAPDVIICDIGLPDMDGYAVANALRNSADHNGCYLISLSGYVQPEDFVKSQKAGFDIHMGKPVDIAKLITTLENKN